MADFNASGIVLRRSQFGETDNILTLYTRERGKISAIAKGARKAVSRLSGATELLASSRFSLGVGRTLQIVRQAEVVDSHSQLREDLRKLANGLYIAELLSNFVIDEDPYPDLFDLLAVALNNISHSQTPDRVTLWFELHLLNLLGFSPILTECTYCGVTMVPVPRGDMALSASQGGVLCPIHAHSRTLADHSLLNQDAANLLQRLSADELFIDTRDVEVTVPPIEQPDRIAAAALRRYIRFRLDRDLNSIAFLDTIRGSK
jgi:DNA repair protein RecO (recombination protein O)